MSDELRVLIILAFWIWDDVFVEDVAHEISIFEAYVASFVFDAHDGWAYFISLLVTDEMAGGFEFFDVRREIQSKYFCFFSKGQEDVFLFKIYECLDVASFGFAFADNFVFVDI